MMNKKELNKTIKDINSVLVKVQNNIAFRPVVNGFNKLQTFILNWEGRIISREAMQKAIMKHFKDLEKKLSRFKQYFDDDISACHACAMRIEKLEANINKLENKCL